MNRAKHLRLKSKFKISTRVNTFKKMIHEQLPLPVPCYDLAPLTESSLGPLAWNFGYPQLAWLDGLEYFKVSFPFPLDKRISRIQRALFLCIRYFNSIILSNPFSVKCCCSCTILKIS